MVMNKAGAFLIFFSAVTLFMCAQEQNSDGQLLEVSLSVKGLVNPLSITNAINSLRNIKVVEQIKNIDRKKSIITITLKPDNTLTLINLEKSIIKALAWAGCACNRLEEMTATGTINKDQGGLFLGVAADKLGFSPMKKNKHMKEKLHQFFKDQTIIKMTASIRKSRDGRYEAYAIKALEILEDNP